MTKKYGMFRSALFCAFLVCIGVLHLALPDRVWSETENRTLAKRPALTAARVADGTFMADAEDYIADQFPGRDGWTGLKARAEQFLGKAEFRGVYLCGDTLINRGDEPGEQAEKNLGYVSALAETAEVPVYLGLIPTASEIWGDRLPAGAPVPDQSAFIQRALEETGVSGVDYLSALQNRVGEKIFYRTDHHWTSLGAYYGYVALCEALGEEAVSLDSFTPETVSTDFNGTLYSTSGVHWLTPDTMEYYVPEKGVTVIDPQDGATGSLPLYDRSYLAKKDKYSSFLGGNRPICIVKNSNAATDRKLLLIRDSYADAMAPFLSQTFAEVHLLDLRYYHLSPAEYARENGVDSIVVSYSVQNFVTDKNLVFLSR
ncbi:DHHW family protein [Oscillibacter sp.]|uniref:DHHW family protein n=1 Tax=Oscillibacter sp. TaxID=1945593 RepID=UPI0028AAEDB1|nr:DHHW family protein [Oscillibacter sp.]